MVDYKIVSAHCIDSVVHSCTYLNVPDKIYQVRQSSARTDIEIAIAFSMLEASGVKLSLPPFEDLCGRIILSLDPVQST